MFGSRLARWPTKALNIVYRLTRERFGLAPEWIDTNELATLYRVEEALAPIGWTTGDLERRGDAQVVQAIDLDGEAGRDQVLSAVQQRREALDRPVALRFDDGEERRI